MIKKLLVGSIAGKKSPIAFVNIISKVFVTSDLNLVESTDESAFLQSLKLKELVTTNTIKEISNEEKSKIRRLSIAPLIAEAVKRIDNYSSVSSLFN